MLENEDELSRLLEQMRRLAISSAPPPDRQSTGAVFNTAHTMLLAIRTRVGTNKSRLDAGLATALENAYPPATDDDWHVHDGHQDEFRFDLG